MDCGKEGSLLRDARSKTSPYVEQTEDTHSLAPPLRAVNSNKCKERERSRSKVGHTLHNNERYKRTNCSIELNRLAGKEDALVLCAGAKKHY